MVLQHKINNKTTENNRTQQKQQNTSDTCHRTDTQNT